MSENNRIESKTYICIALDINTRFIDVIDVCTTIEDGKMSCMKHMDSVATDDGHVDEVRYTKWEPTKADTGICMRYTFYDKEDNPKGSGILVVIEFIRDLTDIMNRLKDTRVLELDHKVPFAYSTQHFKYKVPDDLLKYVRPSDEIIYGAAAPIFRMGAFKWGEPYAIKFNAIKFIIPDMVKSSTKIVYGIAASISKDCKEVTFLTTYNRYGDCMFGRPKEVKISIDQILKDGIVDSITYCGINE